MFLRDVTLASALVFTSGCGLASCEVDRTDELPRAAVPSRADDYDWPVALVPELPPATPATRVTVRVDGVEVSNHELVGTWPASALERARADAPAGEPDWPRIAETVGDRDGETWIRALGSILVRTRRAERAATGSGTGAGVFNLRVESAVPIAELERVLYAAGQAGYGAPRVLLQRGSTEAMLAWPTARPRATVTRAQIEAALTAPGLLELAPSREPRIEMTRDAVRVGDETVSGPVEAAALERLVSELDAGPVVLAVSPDVPFLRVAMALQVLGRAREVRLHVLAP